MEKPLGMIVFADLSFELQEFEGVEVNYVTMQGWKSCIAQCKTFDSLPELAKKYVETIEQHLNIPLKWIGVGPERTAIVNR